MIKMDYNKPQPIIELYDCIQGEGKYVGTPSILIRVVGCKLRCFFEGNFCDTFYSSWNIDPQAKKYTLKEIKEYISKSKIKHIIISGGSPTLYPDLLKELIIIANQFNKFTTIETEGSQFVNTNCDYLSLSPKLNNSIPPDTPTFKTARDLHLANYNNYKAMKDLIQDAKDYQVKFVVSEKIDLEEIFILIEKLEICKEKIWLMPEGILDKQIKEKALWLVPLCIQHNFNFSDRLHIRLFGNCRLT